MPPIIPLALWLAVMLKISNGLKNPLMAAVLYLAGGFIVLTVCGGKVDLEPVVLGVKLGLCWLYFYLLHRFGESIMVWLLFLFLSPALLFVAANTGKLS